MTSHIKAPPARLVNAFDGKKAPEKYFEALSEADDKVGELECLREENAQLQCRVDELDGIAGGLLDERADLRAKVIAARAERDDLAERLDSLDNAHRITLAALAEARRGNTEPWHGVTTRGAEVSLKRECDRCHHLTPVDSLNGRDFRVVRIDRVTAGNGSIIAPDKPYELCKHCVLNLERWLETDPAKVSL